MHITCGGFSQLVLKVTPSAAGSFSSCNGGSDNFATSEAPWDTNLAPRDHPGRPHWEQQNGRGAVWHMILLDFGMIFGMFIPGHNQGAFPNHSVRQSRKYGYSERWSV